MAIQGLDTALGTITGSWNVLGKYSWVFVILFILIILGIIIFFFAYWRKTKLKWNVLFRIRQENKQHGTIYLDPIEIKGKRITLSNGLRLIYLEKEILGKRLFPNLNHYTRPGVYDLIITADNRILLIDGISGIDHERKELKVGIRYPGIDYSLEEVNRDHAKLNKLDRKSDLLGIIKAASIAIVAIVLLVALIIGGKYYIENQEIKAQISQAELQLFEELQASQVVALEQTDSMIILVDKLREVVGDQSIRSALLEAKNETI
jgi:hypothetical protein